MTSLPEVFYDVETFKYAKLEAEIIAQNKILKSYISELSEYIEKVQEYNYFVDLLQLQMDEWYSYTWFDKWFVSEESVVTIKLPSKPTKPTAPPPFGYPAGDQIQWINGGGGYPQSGEIGLTAQYASTSKYFGALGQTSDAGTHSFSFDPDTGSSCKARFVALNLHVHDDAGVSLEDELEVTVSVVTGSITKEYELVEVPSIPSVSLKGEPIDLLEQEAMSINLKIT